MNKTDFLLKYWHTVPFVYADCSAFSIAARFFHVENIAVRRTGGLLIIAAHQNCPCVIFTTVVSTELVSPLN